MKNLIFWLVVMPAMAIVAIVAYFCMGHGVWIASAFAVAMVIASFALDSAVPRYAGLVMLGLTLLVAAFSHPVIAGMALLGLAGIAHFGFHAKWLAIPAAIAGGVTLFLWLIAWVFSLPLWIWLIVALIVADRALYWFRYRGGAHTPQDDWAAVRSRLGI